MRFKLENIFLWVAGGKPENLSKDKAWLNGIVFVLLGSRKSNLFSKNLQFIWIDTLINQL